jgi:parallel beta-helix repeat protein
MKNCNGKVILISLFLFAIILTPSALSVEKEKTIFVNDDGDKDYITLQEALANASDGDTIYVLNGIYDGYIQINKSIKLIGENKENTIIQGIDSPNFFGLITILSDKVTISGFTIKNSIIFRLQDSIDTPLWILDYGNGIYINSNNNIISNNIIQDNERYGILLNNSIKTEISNNYIANHSNPCIYLKNSSNNIIKNNTIINNEQGIIFNITSINNIIYHNNFINNTYYHAHSEGYNIFYNMDLRQGNYWDDYTGIDKNNDARGDEPYNLSGECNQDIYPLTSPYFGALIVEQYYIDRDLVIFYLWIAMFATILFVIPIAYIWYRKTRLR